MVGNAHHRVVVGVDATEGCRAAVAWAAQEARRRELELRLVHVLDWPSHLKSAIWEGLQDWAEQTLAEVAGEVRKHVPEVRVSCVVRKGTTTQGLLAEAEKATMVVLGSRRLGALGGFLLGSVGTALTARSSCPVVVVRSADGVEQWVSGPVVVGVDGSEASAAAVGFAFEEAAYRRVALVAVHAWTEPVLGPPLAIRDVLYGLDVEHRALLSESLAGWREKFPDVIVTEKTVHGHPLDALVSQSKSASLLVVGSRGRGGVHGLLLGSVSQAVLRHVSPPVAVVHGSR